MTEATLIPASDQVQLMLDSPMTEGEQQQLAAIEARATSSAGKITINKIEMAQCLLEVYNDKLFRGKPAAALGATICSPMTSQSSVSPMR